MPCFKNFYLFSYSLSFLLSHYHDFVRSRKIMIHGIPNIRMKQTIQKGVPISGGKTCCQKQTNRDGLNLSTQI